MKTKNEEEEKSTFGRIMPKDRLVFVVGIVFLFPFTVYDFIRNPFV